MKVDNMNRNPLQGGQAYNTNPAITGTGNIKGTGGIDDLIKNLQEQIEAVNKNEKYSEDIKKTKTGQLQKQIEELENLKKAREAEALKPKENKNTKSKNKNYTQQNRDGDTYLSEEDARAIIAADVSKEKQIVYRQTKASMSAQAQMLTHEIENDAARAGGESNDFKTKLLDKLKAGIEGLAKNIYKEIGEINKLYKETFTAQPADSGIEKVENDDVEAEDQSKEETEGKIGKRYDIVV